MSAEQPTAATKRTAEACPDDCENVLPPYCHCSSCAKTGIPLDRHGLCAECLPLELPEAGPFEEGTWIWTRPGPFEDEWGAAVAAAVKHVHEVSQGRVFALVLPRSWSSEQGERLGRCVNRVLQLGEHGLHTMEYVLRV